MAAHSKLSASGSERWLNCPGSVKLSEGMPDPPPSKYATEGTEAHEYLEYWLYDHIILGRDLKKKDFPNLDMYKAVKVAMDFIKTRLTKKDFELLIETRVKLSHIHNSMFGTADICLVKDGDVLEIWDYKHGAGKVVEVMTEDDRTQTIQYNTQLMYYAIGAAFLNEYNFKNYVVGVIQPRAKHPLGPIRSVMITREELKNYEKYFKRGVKEVFKPEPKLRVGPWCHWCKAQTACPEKNKQRFGKFVDMF